MRRPHCPHSTRVTSCDDRAATPDRGGVVRAVWPGCDGTPLAHPSDMSDLQFATSAHAFTDVEEEFFRAGNALSEVETVESFSDLDIDFQRPSLWQRLFGKQDR